ncbi:MAG: hypothetical protein KDB00_05250 [Planctomycetales bacterium]|nr:hypothetical protein [Planctomycetales bacterium]
MITRLIRSLWGASDGKPVVTTFALLMLFAGLRSAVAETLPIESLPDDRDVLFSRDIAPVLKKNCVACHNVGKEEGGVNLESVDKMTSSDVDDILVPGKPDASRLFLLASHADDPVMPPEDNDVSASNFAPMELALLRRWIEKGAPVDQAMDNPSPQVWQPLPTALQTVYGAAMTDDGRLAAISYGNQVRLFGTKSPRPIGVLERFDGTQTKPAHDDFVQDLFLDSNGRRVVSSGYRSVTVWEMNAFETIPVPKIDLADDLAVSLNRRGDYVAALSRRGELSVAEIGKERWQWMKGFDLPEVFQGDHRPNVRLAVAVDGRQVAIAWDKTIRIVRTDAIAAETIDVPNPITSILWRADGRLAAADDAGQVTFWTREGDVWTAKNHAAFDQPVVRIDVSIGEPERFIAMDATGKVAMWNGATQSFDDAGKLPAPAVSASLSAAGDSIWVTTAEGGLAQYIIADKKLIEAAKTDPVSAAHSDADNWITLVGERLVAAQDSDVKQAEANVKAENESIEKFTKDIESKTTLRDEKQKALDEAKKAAETASMKLSEAKSVEQSANENRSRLTESIKAIGAKVSELEAELAKLKAEQASAEKELAAIPDAKKLADDVAAATQAATKSDEEKAKKESELKDAIAALELAEATKVRGAKRLDGLNAELQRRRQVLDQAKADQETRKAAEANSKAARDRSHATDATLVVMSGGARVMTRAELSGDNDSGSKPGAWSLWSGAGDWLAEVPNLPTEGKVVAAGDDYLLLADADGTTRAMKPATRLWRQTRTIGSSTGESPFADRVLCVDMDPSGNLLATGGGQPSRAGELMIWNATDGALVRKIENPHDDTVLCVRFSPDGKTLASGGADRMVKLWDVESGELLKTLEGHTHHVTAIAWNVNQRQLASGSADESVKIWDLESGQSTRTISGLKTEVTKLVYVGRDDRIGVVGGDSYFRVYRTDNGARETNAKVVGGYLYALDANRDGSQFVMGGADGVAVLVDKSGKQQLEFSAGD